MSEENTPPAPHDEGVPIWYAYLRSDGSFQGSGITKYDDGEFNSTLIPHPPYVDIVELPFFDVATETWEVRSLVVAPEPEVDPGEEQP